MFSWTAVYYARQKRICSEPRLLNSGFLLHPFSMTNSSNITCGDGSNLQNQHSVGNMSLGQEDLLTCYGHPGSLDDEPMRRFNSVDSGGNDAQHSFHADHVGSIQGEDPDEVVEPDHINRYYESTCIESFEKSQINNVHQLFEADFIKKDPSHMLQEKVFLDVFSDGHEVRQTEILAENNLSDSDIIETEALPSPGSNNEDHDGFTGNSSVSLQIPQCGHECPSPAVEVPLWRAESDVSQEILAINMQCENEEVTGVVDGSNINTPRCDGTVTKGNMSDGQKGVGVIRENNLVDFLMEFPEDDPLYFLDMDDKVVDVASSLHEFESILVNSFSDECDDDVHVPHGPKEATQVDKNLSFPDVAASWEMNKHCGQEISGHRVELIGFVSGEGAPSTAPKLFISAEPCETLVCVLNTEDTEIPENSDVVIPVQLSSQSSASLNLLSRLMGETTMANEKHLPTGHTSASAVRAKSLLSAGFRESTDGCVTGNQSFEGGIIAGVSQDPGIAANGPKLCILHTSSSTLNGGNATCNLANQVRLDPSMSSHFANPASASGQTKCYSQNIVNGCKKEIDVQATLANCTLSLHPEISSAVDVSMSDQEEQISGSEDDVPSFSDVEAMIFDMDLGPYDQESYFLTKEDSRYQSANDKKTFIRLEQKDRAYMNRLLLCHGAFAVLYGHHLKYFIRNPEVSLGRATEDVKVDIDLGREGRANKISQRQAIIKMDLFF